MGYSHLSRLSLQRRLIAATLALLGLATGAHGRSLEAVKQSGVLRVAVYRFYKPFSWKENGQLKGIDVDIGAALAKKLGVKVDYMDLRADDQESDDLRNGVWKGTVTGEAPSDVMLHVPYDSHVEAKNHQIKLYAPYFKDGLAMAVNSGMAAKARDLSLFETQKVAVEIGSLGDLILLGARDHRLIGHVVHERGLDKAIKAYADGDVVAYYGEASAAEALKSAVKQPTELIHPSSPLARDWTIGAAVKSGSTGLGPAIAAAMLELQTSGRLQKIFAAYGVTWEAPSTTK